MRILITGSKGFVGSHLKSVLETKYEIVDYNRGDKLDLNVDKVFHCAGVMRPKDPEDYFKVNYGLTKSILNQLKYSGKKIPFVLLSTTQVGKDNMYANSKAMAEFEAATYTGCIYRLPNTFGAGAKPHYNSVVSTWMYDIKHGNPIRINNKDQELEIAYIDDVVACVCGNNRGVNFIEPTYNITLGDLADRIYAIKDGATRGDDLHKKLVKTYESY